MMRKQQLPARSLHREHVLCIQRSAMIGSITILTCASMLSKQARMPNWALKMASYVMAFITYAIGFNVLSGTFL